MSEASPERVPALWWAIWRQHALGWLAAANAIGVILAWLLVRPEDGRWLGGLTYGRWMPLHMNWHLYGSCALPLVGPLWAWMRPADGRADRWFGLSLGGWSLALLLGGVSWLGGTVSGKLFLDWAGPWRAALPLAMMGLWATLAAAYRQRSTRCWLRLGVLAGLAPVPAVFFWATSPGVYPPVDTETGGATGAALLGSTLGIVGLYGVLPHWAGLGRLRPWAWPERGIAWLYALSWGIYFLLNRGDSSNRDLAQQAGLAVLLLWIPLGVYWLVGYEWTPRARRWLVAGLVWWSLLALSGWISFTPEVAARWKFTHGLVGHAHLAMGGLVVSMGMAFLEQAGGSGRSLSGWGSFIGWQVALGTKVTLLLLLGWSETQEAGAFFRGEGMVAWVFPARLVLGALMTAVSILWWKRTWR